MDIQKISSGSSSLIPQIRPDSERPQHQMPPQDKDNARPRSGGSAQVAGYNFQGRPEGVSENGSEEPGALKHAITREVFEQAWVQLQIYSDQNGTELSLKAGFMSIQSSEGSSNDPLGLMAYFRDNPDDWQQVQNGEIPDFFNVENTGNRILDIWLGNADANATDPDWLTEVRDLINQAYDDVSGMIGDLPEIVQETRAYVEEQLNALIEAAGNAGENSSNLIDTLA